MKYSYRAYDRGGTLATGLVEGGSAAVVREMLKQRGLFVSDLQATSDGAGERGTVVGAARPRGRGAKRLQERAHFLRQLSVLVGTGTPLVDAVCVLEKQTKPGPWLVIVSDIRKKVEEGASLSSALEGHPVQFDGVCRSLIQAGESRGNLADMLVRLADLTRQQVKVRAAFIGAMIYPCLLLAVAFTVVITMLVFVMPRFEGLFSSLGAALPPTTKALMALGGAIRGYWWAMLIGAAGIGVGAWMWFHSPAGVRIMHLTLLRTPKVGTLIRAFITARVARLLGVLLDGKVALIDALQLTRQAAGNQLYEDLFVRTENAVTKGIPMSEALGDAGHGELITPSVIEAIKSGERTGQVGPVLLQVADFMDEDNEVILKSLSSIVEPLILIVLGCVVGVVAISMFLPLFDLTSGVGGGGAP